MKPKIPLPDLDASDVPDIRSLTPEELAQVPAEIKWWTCCAANCERRTRVKDFGIHPIVFWRKEWVDLSHHAFWCAKHWPVYNRMIKGKREDEFIFKPVNEINILS